MNLGQTMLTAGMLVLLIMCVVSANRMINENTEAQFQTRALVASASLANDLLLEIASKKFDEKSDSVGGLATIGFSEYQKTKGEWWPKDPESAACPQPDSSYTGAFKSITAYNDVDDYDGYHRIADADGISGFDLWVVVYYVSPGAPDTKLSVRSFFKKVEVNVSHPIYLIPHPIYLTGAVYSAVVSY
jgi:hypothetical protein